MAEDQTTTNTTTTPATNNFMSPSPSDFDYASTSATTAAINDYMSFSHSDFVSGSNLVAATPVTTDAKDSLNYFSFEEKYKLTKFCYRNYK